MRHRVPVLLALAWLCACRTGAESGPDPASSSSSSSSGGTSSGGSAGSSSATSSSGGSSSGGSSPSSSSSSGGVPAECQDRLPGGAPVRLLTRTEYDNTARDLLGDTTRPARAFPQENQALGFNNNADAHRASPLLVTLMQDAAESVATRAVSTRLTTLCPCAATVPNDGIQDQAARTARITCGQQFISTFGRRAFRRPLHADETMGMQMLLGQQVDAGRPFADVIAMLVEAFLQSPGFLYRVVEIQPGETDGAIIQLSDHEVASRLSYFLWASMPDDALLDAAARGELRSLVRVRAEAERMLQDPRARDALRDFHAQWLKLDKLDTVERDVPAGTDLAALRVGWKEGVQRFLDHAVLEATDSLDVLFGSSRTYVDAATAALYGAPTPSGDLAAVELPPDERGAGLLSQPALMALLSHPGQTSPVLRGIFVREQLMCEHMDPPPPGLVITPPAPDPTATTRERFSQHTVDPNCYGCHVRMDPVGFGFEKYDALGRYRATENGLPVDASGEVLAVEEDFDLEGPFDGAAGLAARLKQSHQVSTCMTRQWFRYAFGRGESAAVADRCTVAIASESFSSGNHDIKQLLVTLATSDAMRLRPGKTPGEVPPITEPDAGVPMEMDAGTITPDAGQPGATTPAPPIGFLDSVSAAGLVSGWALDTNVPSYALSIETWLDGPPGVGEYLYPVYRADLPRADVNQVTGWQGDHGFRFVLPARLHDGMEHRLWIVAQDAGDDGSTTLPGSGITFRIGQNNRLPSGYVDVVGPTVVGWAYDPDSSPTAIRVQFWMDGPPWGTGTLLGESMTGGDRPDVNAAFMLDAATRSGWSFALPSNARDGRNHLLWVVALDATLPDSIFTLLGDTAHAFQVTP